MPLMPGRLMSMRITSGWLARAKLDAPSSVGRTEQAHIRAARDELLDQLQIGRVVLHIEQRPQQRAVLRLSLQTCRRFGRVRRQLRGRGRLQFEPEYAALADRAFHADLAAHQLHQALAHHQADAGAFLGAPLLAEPIERLEKLVQHLRSQPRASVPDADADAVRAANGAAPPLRRPFRLSGCT